MSQRLLPIPTVGMNRGRVSMLFVIFGVWRLPHAWKFRNNRVDYSLTCYRSVLGIRLVDHPTDQKVS